MESPCKTCLVRPICRKGCKEFLNIWAPFKMTLDTFMSYSNFLEKVGDYGPVKNNYNQYKVTQIKLIKRNGGHGFELQIHT